MGKTMTRHERSIPTQALTPSKAIPTQGQDAYIIELKMENFI